MHELSAGGGAHPRVYMSLEGEEPRAAQDLDWLNPRVTVL